ncbi:MAG: cupin-like domain-containing protein, partial [Pseudomonadota bacterium]
MQQIPEWRDVDRAAFDSEIVPRGEPAVVRSVVEDWPAVASGKESRASLARYLGGFDTGQPVTAMVAPPTERGRFFYSEGFTGFNFTKRQGSVTEILGTLLDLATNETLGAVAVQAIPAPSVLPGFEQQNPLSLLDGSVGPRIWLGNRARIAPHIDNDHNIACVVAGTRRFTLFPPEQVENLYVGPLLNTPGGAPISTVDLHELDLECHPRFEQALDAAREAVLEPGDAIYMPALWWHGVEALDDLNVLVNYWWNEVPLDGDNPFHSLLHAMLAVARLPADQRRSWG